MYFETPSANEAYFWFGAEEFAHITKRIEDSETPAGSEAHTFVGFCGKEMESWTMGGLPDPHWASEEYIKKLGKLVCSRCLKARDEK